MKTLKSLSALAPSPPSAKSGWGGFIGLGLICLGIGIGITSKLSVLTCNRVETDKMTCSIIEEDLLELDVERMTLEKLQRAEVRIRIDPAGETERLVLVGEKQELEIQAFEGDAKEASIEINDFVEDLNEESVTLRKDDRWFSYFFGVVLAIAGLFQTGLLKVSSSRNFNRS
ncbi:hypothetical protein IQ235_17310 [Oscillatoriales cyanobacterium LEGE 11467]|uniref:Uncharacterized protein n=1 Tax=Zarconia navalis LEGE 11467 TaxID=1828826 RepID=A0A928VYM8_9CYAN|nr:hypothetical protein [Zarconia navalis]MBE9042531.1 hypothetical protein [Zarconia navalis LEGE 11467]